MPFLPKDWIDKREGYVEPFDTSGICLVTPEGKSEPHIRIVLRLVNPRLGLSQNFE